MISPEMIVVKVHGSDQAVNVVKLDAARTGKRFQSLANEALRLGRADAVLDGLIGDQGQSFPLPALRHFSPDPVRGNQFTIFPPECQ